MPKRYKRKIYIESNSRDSHGCNDMRKSINTSERQRGKSEALEQIQEAYYAKHELPDPCYYTKSFTTYTSSVGGQLILTLIKLDIVDKYDWDFFYGFKNLIPFVYCTTIEPN